MAEILPEGDIMHAVQWSCPGEIDFVLWISNHLKEGTWVLNEVITTAY